MEKTERYKTDDMLEPESAEQTADEHAGHSTDHLPTRIFLLCAGLSIMAFGIALSIKATLGTSPISSVPYVTARISGLSVGITTIVMNFIFILIQIAILRKRYDWFQLLQFPAAVLFGLIIDAASLLTEKLPCDTYLQQWIICAAGVLFIAFGVSVEISAGLITTSGEGIVLAICQVAPVKFGNMKVALDCSLACISILLSFAFLGGLDGVREGTVAAAIFVGIITKKTNGIVEKVSGALLER